MKPIYCDNHLLVLNKPAGVATQPDFHEWARTWVKNEFKKPGNVFLEPIHRLDKAVGGIVVFARTSKALSRLNEALRNKSMRKIYEAQVEGHVDDEGVLEHYLVHGDFKAFVDPKGKKATLRYKCLKRDKTTSWVEIELETGRYHQIRAQFSAIGHPVVGDHKYGSQTKQETIALHHKEMTLTHPTTGEKLVFVSSCAI